MSYKELQEYRSQFTGKAIGEFIQFIKKHKAVKEQE